MMGWRLVFEFDGEDAEQVDCFLREQAAYDLWQLKQSTPLRPCSAHTPGMG